jgi:hypothetical protein
MLRWQEPSVPCMRHFIVQYQLNIIINLMTSWCDMMRAFMLLSGKQPSMSAHLLLMLKTAALAPPPLQRKQPAGQGSRKARKQARAGEANDDAAGDDEFEADTDESDVRGCSWVVVTWGVLPAAGHVLVKTSPTVLHRNL